MKPMPWETEGDTEVAAVETVAPMPPHREEVCVPMAAVAIADTEQQTEPQPGDTVAVTLEGKVSRVEGGKVYFAPETANGEPMPQEQSEEQELAAEGEALRTALATA